MFANQQADPINPLTPFFNNQSFIVLDGGLATQLEKKGADLNDPLWSAKIIYENPDLLYKVALEYLEAGADIIVTASYQASIDGFVKKGFSTEEAEKLILKSTQIPLQARRDFWADPANRKNRIRPLVAASVGPYGASLADGSEYKGNYQISDTELNKFHRQRLKLLANTNIDLIAFETFPSWREAQIVLHLLPEISKKMAWISFSIRDEEHIADGAPIEKILADCEKHPQIAAIGFNCFAPSLVSPLLKKIRPHIQKPIIIYPNNGNIWNAEKHCWEFSREEPSLSVNVTRWLNEGVRILGGCCQTTPDDIAVIRAALK